MYAITNVAGHAGGECFLVVSKETALLLDAGFDFCADKTVANIRSVLGSRPLDYILATHTHYDHIGGAAAVKEAYPELKVVGSLHARKVLANENAKAQMRTLNAGCARDAGYPDAPDRVGALGIDVALEDGDELRLPDMTVRAVATPGHTRCSMSYFFLEEGLLACSETIGIAPCYPAVIPCMIVGYEMTLDSIERSRRLRPRRVFVPHSGLIPEGEEGRFFENARRAVTDAGAMLLALSARGCGEEEIIDALAEVYYSGSSGIQPKRAFELNTRALIQRILPELQGTPKKTA